MFDRPPAIALLTAGCLVALVAGGAGLFSTDDATPADPEQLVEEMLAEQPDAVDGNLQEVVERNDTVLERTQFDVITEPPEDQKRVRIVRPEEGNLTVVQNETTAWTYHESEQKVTRYDIADSERGVIVPAIRYRQYETLIEEFDMRYAGTERVAGHEAHVVVFTDPSDEPTTASIDVIVGNSEYSLVETTLAKPLVLGEHRLWIHAEHDYPLKERTTLVGRDGNTVNFTTRYDRIEFDADHDEGTFQFDPPEDATRRDPPEMDSERFDSLDAAASAVSYPIPRPTVPEPFELDSVIVSRVNDTTRVRVAYSDGNESIRVRVFPDFDHDIEGMSVSVGDHPGILAGGQGTSSLYWECADRTYALYGPVSAEQKITIAESIDCEASGSATNG